MDASGGCSSVETSLSFPDVTGVRAVYPVELESFVDSHPRLLPWFTMHCIQNLSPTGRAIRTAEGHFQLFMRLRQAKPPFCLGERLYDSASFWDVNDVFVIALMQPIIKV